MKKYTISYANAAVLDIGMLQTDCKHEALDMYSSELKNENRN